MRRVRPYHYDEGRKRYVQMWAEGGVQFRLNECLADGYCENHKHFFDHITTVYHDFMLKVGDETEWRLLTAGSSELIPRETMHTFKPVVKEGVERYKFVCSWLLDWEETAKAERAKAIA